jgi:hypothetical protein
VGCHRAPGMRLGVMGVVGVAAVVGVVPVVAVVGEVAEGFGGVVESTVLDFIVGVVSEENKIKQQPQNDNTPASTRHGTKQCCLPPSLNDGAHQGSTLSDCYCTPAPRESLEFMHAASKQAHGTESPQQVSGPRARGEVTRLLDCWRHPQPPHSHRILYTHCQHHRHTAGIHDRWEW